jgi:hypothetical protein
MRGSARAKECPVSDDYSVQIIPQLRGHTNVLDLIQSAGTLVFSAPGVDLNRENGILFDVNATSEGYRLITAIDDGHLVIIRNGRSAAIRLPNTASSVRNYAMWDPSMISAFAAAPDETGALTPAEIEAMTQRTYFDPPVRPPSGLIGWARRQALTPTTIYSSKRDRIDAVVSALRGLEDKIQTQAMQHAFWDMTRERNTVVAKKPKRETDIHPTLAGLLTDAAIVRNIEMTRERPAGAGRLDFSFAAPLRDGGFARVCAEFKRAQSSDLEHGLTHQLPEYMHSEGADFGVYGVLWFKGADFDEPARAATVTDLKLQLDVLAREDGVRDVRLLLIDVGFRASPSKK